MLVSFLSNMLTLCLLKISLASKAQRTERYLLREKEMWKAVKSFDQNFNTNSFTKVKER